MRDIPGSPGEAAYAALATSTVYREVLRETDPPLHPWMVPYGALDFADLYRTTSAMRAPESGTFVDLGCGLGGGSLWFLHGGRHELIGIDLSPAAIAGARTLAASVGHAGDARFCVAAAEATGLPGASVDDAVSFDALAYMDAPAVIRELDRILKPGGRFSCTATEWIGASHPPLATFERDYRALFEAANYRVDWHRYLEPDRGARFARALVGRDEKLRAEIGDAAAGPVLSAAREFLASLAGAPRRRDVFFSAAKAP
jgi:SAM-dependent methyltransferase